VAIPEGKQKIEGESRSLTASRLFAVILENKLPRNRFALIAKNFPQVHPNPLDSVGAGCRVPQPRDVAVNASACARRNAKANRLRVLHVRHSAMARRALLWPA